MERYIHVLLGCLLVACLVTGEARSIGTATVPEQGPGGTKTRIRSGDEVFSVTDDATRGAVQWHRHFDDAIYLTAAISSAADVAAAGTYWNAPIHVEAVPLSDDGTADWTFEGNHFLVDASRGGEVIAAVDFSDADSTAIIREWRPDASTPLWTERVHPCRSLVYQGWSSRKPVQVSDDGSTIAVALVMYTPSGQRGRLYVFDAGSGTPAVVYDFPTGNVVATAISAEGDYIAMAGWPYVYVYDRYAEALRWSGTIGGGNDALAISGDGRYLAWGWSTFNLREWNGATYASLWTHSPGGGLYTGQCGFAPDGTALAVAWDNGNNTDNEIWVDLYALPSLEILWTYDYAGGAGAPGRDHVDIPSQLVFAPNGERFAIASWGGSFPEVHVFDRAQREPILVYDTPGSMFDIDIATSIRGDTFVTACGKAVHAGQGGRGGDHYAFRIPGPSSGVGPAPSLGLRGGLDASLRGDGSVRIDYALPRDGQVRLTVHDAAGRVVGRLLEGYRPAGWGHVVWGASRAPSGVYYAHLLGEGNREVGRFLIVR